MCYFIQMRRIYIVMNQISIFLWLIYAVQPINIRIMVKETMQQNHYSWFIYIVESFHWLNYLWNMKGLCTLWYACVNQFCKAVYLAAAVIVTIPFRVDVLGKRHVMAATKDTRVGLKKVTWLKLYLFII